MALDVLSRPPAAARLAPVEQRYAPLFGFALLTAACALASFALACATPFAAFAVIAAAMLPLHQALLVVTGAWLVNQGIGFCALHYPIDASTLAWGLVIGAAALAATCVASLTLRVWSGTATSLALTLALLCAYPVYEFVLLTATTVLGGASSFTAGIVGRIGLTSMAWLVGMVAVCEIIRLIDARRRHAI